MGRHIDTYRYILHLLLISVHVNAKLQCWIVNFGSQALSNDPAKSPGEFLPGFCQQNRSKLQISNYKSFKKKMNKFSLAPHHESQVP